MKDEERLNSAALWKRFPLSGSDKLEKIYLPCNVIEI